MSYVGEHDRITLFQNASRFSSVILLESVAGPLCTPPILSSSILLHFLHFNAF